MKKRYLIAAAIVSVVLLGFAAGKASAYGSCDSGYGGSYLNVGYGSYDVGYGSYSRGGYGRWGVHTWHDTTHLDYHRGYYTPHYGHGHYTPGHFDVHYSGHRDHHHF